MGAERDFMGRCVTEYVEGRPALYFNVQCRGCDREEKVRTPTPRMGPELIRHKLHKLGWHVGQRVLCDQCLAARKARPTEPETTMSANNNDAAPLPASATVSVVPPPSPKPEDRRRVREALYEHYLEDKGCYRQAFTDKSLAAKLDVPSKWVSEIREAMGFGPDVNEAGALASAELVNLRQALQGLSEDFLAKFTVLEARLKRLEVDRAYAA